MLAIHSHVQAARPRRLRSTQTCLTGQPQALSAAVPISRTFQGDPVAKPTTIKIRLNSTAGTGYFYVTKKNTRTMTEKMVVRKYDPVARKHVEFKEGKIK